MVWDSQGFPGGSIIPPNFCEDCSAQVDLEPAWKRKACLPEVRKLSSLSDVFNFLLNQLRVPLPPYDFTKWTSPTPPCFGFMRRLFYNDWSAMNRIVVEMWNMSFLMEGKVAFSDLEVLLEDVKRDMFLANGKANTPITSRSFRQGTCRSTNTSFTGSFATMSAANNSAATSFSSTNGWTSVKTSFSDRSDTSVISLGADWQKSEFSQKIIDVHDSLRKSFAQEIPVVPAEVKNKSEDIAGSLENHVVTSIPTSGLFVEGIPQGLRTGSSSLRWELTRIASFYDVPLRDLIFLTSKDENVAFESLWSSAIEVAQQLQSDKAAPATNFPSIQLTTNEALSKADCPNVVRTAKLAFLSRGSGSVFKLVLHPLKLEPKSSRFARKFGAHRFLTLSIPSLKNDALPDYLHGQAFHLRRRLLEWLLVPDKEFMGYSWSVFVTKTTTKTKKMAKHGDSDILGGFSVTLFATKGFELSKISMADLLNWFMPLQFNLAQPLCKVFARIDLGFSKTYPTLVIKPRQMRRIGDRLADGSPEDSALNDEDLIWADAQATKSRVMNDGCSRISPAAAGEVWELLQQNGPVPSAFQARIGPYKGVWMVSGDTPSLDTGPGDVWIEVSDSQKKFHPDEGDLDDETYDEHRLTFEVITWTRKPSPSVLYRDYLPILEDRGVDKRSLEVFVAHLLAHEQRKIEKALQDPQQSFKWLQDNFSTYTDRPEETKRDSAPNGLEPAIKMLLESGFEVPKLSYLAQQFRSLLTWQLTRVSGSLNLPLQRSTMVMGIADPTGLLKPNEIHLAFSSNFSDDSWGNSYGFLHDTEALVARHPSLRRSDIQKVRATFKMELRHLVDVVVFPVTGSYPLAGKLQGGDYDGDTFWVCWEPALVRSFRNAPVPLNLKPPEHYGIKVDRMTLGDISHRQDALQCFFRQSFEIAWKPSHLGISTNFHAQLCYHQNSISTEDAEAIVDVHDYLVDAVKNGYTFDQEAWDEFRKSLRYGHAKMLSPAYKAASELELERPKDERHNPEHIIDYLVFDVARRQARGVLTKVKQDLTTTTKSQDTDVSALWLSYASRPELAREVRRLGDDLQDLRGKWLGPGTMEDKTAEERRHAFNDAKIRCQKLYRQIKPLACIEEDPWAREAIPNVPSLRDLVKASALFHLHGRQGAFVFACAGLQIGYLKVHAAGMPYFAPWTIAEKLKMRKLDGGRAVVDLGPGRIVTEEEGERVESSGERLDEDFFYDAAMDLDLDEL